MKDGIYLVISENRVERMTRTPPSLNASEVYIFLNITVPKHVFRRPVFQGEIYASEHNNSFLVEVKEIEQALAKLKQSEKENVQ